MLDWILIGFAIAVGGGAERDDAAGARAQMQIMPDAEYVAEDQTPSGKFLTATEVKPILGMTRASWIAVREYDGQDLLYVTHLLSWRCGLHEIRYAVNGGPMQVWPMPPCLTDTAAPNAIRTEDGLPFVSFALGSVESVQVELLYDDLSRDSAEFARAQVLMP